MHTPTTGSERSFGLTVGGVFALMAGWSIWAHHTTRSWIFGGLALALILPALLYPQLLRVPNIWWWRLAGVLGWVNSRILLSLIFFVMFTPIGLVMRLFGRDSLRRRPVEGSTWTVYTARQHDPKHYDRMY